MDITELKSYEVGPEEIDDLLDARESSRSNSLQRAMNMLDAGGFTPSIPEPAKVFEPEPVRVRAPRPPPMPAPTPVRVKLKNRPVKLLRAKSERI